MNSNLLNFLFYDLLKRSSEEIDPKWIINKKVKITESISKIEFSSPLFAIKNHMNGVQWFGRYFTV